MTIRAPDGYIKGYDYYSDHDMGPVEINITENWLISLDEYTDALDDRRDWLIRKGRCWSWTRRFMKNNEKMGSGKGLGWRWRNNNKR
jgi:hypothetical protein